MAILNYTIASREQYRAKNGNRNSHQAAKQISQRGLNISDCTMSVDTWAVGSSVIIVSSGGPSFIVPLNSLFFWRSCNTDLWSIRSLVNTSRTGLQGGIQQQVGSSSAFVQVGSVAWQQPCRGWLRGDRTNPQVMWAQVGRREEQSSFPAQCENNGIHHFSG